jgi:hypothetical protein
MLIFIIPGIIITGFLYYKRKEIKEVPTEEKEVPQKPRSKKAKKSTKNKTLLGIIKDKYKEKELKETEEILEDDSDIHVFVK